ncbi:hypothetical protein [Methylobacterium oxalidis]|uniref:Uncharacterized protein n=1 Tax=Methylobacterium oxalidis TaxID=944322 RepID=A0A512IX23_9HYPH|nr:hypothetical protein [Methylobacterium oxalidis]GEP02270.1 hypothetical protein MOX02_03080 [Methylobacterium oxalidis]GJE32261.1 hypothetical protein LDDCCGHA_2447 [Methylobacterium oxalidis]GLS62215.1 hypothetical protein GCM10007888_05960 [Methylobacterium oxalidis]
MTRTLHLERPAFWTESSDPESWFRALDAVAAAVDQGPQSGTPRTVAERCLVGITAWRGAAGLFGAFHRGGVVRLPGVGLISCDSAGQWALNDEAQVLLRHWKEDPLLGLELLAAHLVRESPWLRLLLLRLQSCDWALAGWAKVRSHRAGLKAGVSLLLHAQTEPERWFEGLESRVAARWLARLQCESLGYTPEVLLSKKGKDDLSLTPLTAPLLLLESVGWLTRTGELRLPSEVQADLTGTLTPAQALTQLSSGRADVRGFVAVEPVLRDLLATFGANPRDVDFPRWMDTLIDQAMQHGALEVLAAEPGQARHGRGLHADPTRKLVRWIVHPEFSDAFQKAWDALETTPELT